MVDTKEKIKVERDFLALLIKHLDLVGDWQESNLRIDMFDEDHQLILYAIQWAYANDALLTRKSYAEYVKQQSVSKLKTAAEEALFNRLNLMMVKRDDFHVLKSKITEAFVDEHSLEAIKSFTKNATDKGSMFAAKKLVDQMNGLVFDVEAKKPTIFEGVDTYAPKHLQMMKEKRDALNEVEKIRCYIKEIDETMVVGFAPGTLTLFCADVGGYKSTMMLNVGSNVWKLAKKNVLIVPLEMPRQFVYQKFLSRETGIPFDRLENPKILTAKEWELLEKAHDEWNKWQHKFFFMESMERCSVGTIRREIEKHLDVFRPHLVIVDYIANLVPEHNAKYDRPDLAIGEMLKDLRQMGRPGVVHKDGFATVSGAQIGREALKRTRRAGAGKVNFYSEDLRGSHEYSADADNIYAQAEDPTQPSQRLSIFVIKARYGKKSFKSGGNSATVEIKPEVSLIKSINDTWQVAKRDDLLKRTEDTNIEEESLEFDAKPKKVEVVEDDSFDRTVEQKKALILPPTPQVEKQPEFNETDVDDIVGATDIPDEPKSDEDAEFDKEFDKENFG